MTEFSDWTNAKRVLCIRLDALGDVVMTGPAIRALASSRPGRRIDLLTSRGASAIGAYLPGVRETLTYDAPWMKATSPLTNSEYDRQFIDQLRQRRYDAAVIFTVYSQSPLPAALLCYLADIPRRLAHCRENPYHLLSDWAHETEPQQMRHEVQRQLDLVAHVGATPDHARLQIRLPSAALALARQIVAEAGVQPEMPWILIHPGASAPSRRYAPERYALAARAFAIEHGYAVVFSGIAEERGLIEQIREQMRAPSYVLPSKLDIATLTGVIKLAPLIVTNNTGPAHLAAAVGTPVVDLYALTNPQHTPWKVPNRVLNRDVPCKHCYRSVCPVGHHECLRVPPEDVVQAGLELLGA